MGIQLDTPMPDDVFTLNQPRHRRSKGSESTKTNRISNLAYAGCAVVISFATPAPKAGATGGLSVIRSSLSGGIDTSASLTLSTHPSLNAQPNVSIAEEVRAYLRDGSITTACAASAKNLLRIASECRLPAFEVVPTGDGGLIIDFEDGEETVARSLDFVISADDGAVFFSAKELGQERKSGLVESPSGTRRLLRWRVGQAGALSGEGLIFG